MATMTVWRFPTADGAAEALHVLRELQRRKQIVVENGVVVSWPAHADEPTTSEPSSLTGMGALGGGFWGLLIGSFFLAPVVGTAVGAAAGAAAGHFARAGVDPAFIARVRERVTPGTSALFLLTSHAVLEGVRPAFAPLHGELIETDLSPEQEARLRAIADDAADSDG
ncbi:MULTISPECIES: DUF1269 domain-containing protein [Kitasatospora]|uniref:Membrane protein n=2 Tax=Kitasatospora TaxID=2063 RepID=A0ABT1JA46_9ACTN|nr:DUF1269 domain-containing protein [Kitasatospora paracochleata]MCP2314333.1 putative membrane protein [Kitasatospora paracochleata]